MSLKFEIIETVDDFLKLQDAWNELVDSSDSPYAFMLHEWFKHWMIDFDKTDGLKIVTAYSDNKLSAIAPLRITREKLRFFPCDVLSFMSSSISPRCNFIIHDSIDSERFFEFIFENVKGWDLFITNNIDKNAPTTKKYLDFLSKKHTNKYTLNYNRITPYKVHDTDWDTFFNGMSKSNRRNIRQAYRNAERMGNLEIEKFFTFEKLEPVIEQVFSVSGESWKASDGTDLVSRKKMADFYRNFSKETSDKKLWQLITVKIDGKYIAFDYCLSYKNRISGLRSDFDENFRKVMPGHIMRAEIVKDLIERDTIWEYDMGGNVTDNKLGWTDQKRKHLGIAVSNTKLYGNFLIYLRKLFRFLKNNEQSEILEQL